MKKETLGEWLSHWGKTTQKEYDPSQPRDENGMWTDSGGSSHGKVKVIKVENDPSKFVPGTYKMRLSESDLKLVKEHALSKISDEAKTKFKKEHPDTYFSESKAMLDGVEEILSNADVGHNPKGSKLSWKDAVHIARNKFSGNAVGSVQAVTEDIVVQAGQLRSTDHQIRTGGKKMKAKYSGRDAITGARINVGDNIIYSNKGTVLE